MIKNTERMLSVTDKFGSDFNAAFEKLEVEKLAFSKQKSFNDGADFSEESSNYAMKDLQMQATSSVLTQANS
ncbi:MAG: hypothetical protein MK033_00525 [Candidatus Caenarcaniphilales bacterium]|nr:hypothetical protein [Candidatus Caenarcaniphilales bacterium]